MASKQQMTEQDMSGQTAQELGEQAFGPAFLASAASVGLALYYFFVRGDRQRGLFVGLWAPTILGFAGYINQRKILRQIETITQPGTTLRNAIDSMMGNQ
ncbi:hypothetical protein ACFOZ7_01635 [Natribaculum luteum]|uniref:Uncharacterized protein n=1 Tax=Natribaculum luteum TaxID=1586232 RepID=A0ABD5NUF0_9EURY|nr:hypothetical protein [Natribaculum luteum]